MQMADNRGRDDLGVRQGGRTARTSQTVSLGGPPKTLKGVDQSQYDYEFEEVEEKTTASH